MLDDTICTHDFIMGENRDHTLDQRVQRLREWMDQDEVASTADLIAAVSCAMDMINELRPDDYKPEPDYKQAFLDAMRLLNEYGENAIDEDFGSDPWAQYKALCALRDMAKGNANG